MSIQVIANADDYGLDENRTRAIQSAFKMGAITATTATANRPWFERAMSEAKDLGFLPDIGLHFNLTEGEPLTDEMRNCRELCDERGYFTADFHRKLKTRLLLPHSARRAIRAEAEAQIVKYLDCGGTLMHLDSHHHVHTDFSVTGSLYDVARKYGFKSARLSRNLGGEMSVPKRIYKFAWNHFAGLRIPFRADYFCAFGDFAALYKSLPSDAIVEIMTHPLYRDDNGLTLSGTLCDSCSPMSEECSFWSEARDSVKLIRYCEITDYN